MIKAILAICIGASSGALLRWQLSEKLNKLNWLPLGTLAANLIAGYIIGIAMAFFSQHTTLSNEAKLLIITGFCGGLSTFSTFSSEIVKEIQVGQLQSALILILVHVVGSVLMTFLGIWSFQFFKS